MQVVARENVLQEFEHEFVDSIVNGTQDVGKSFGWIQGMDGEIEFNTHKLHPRKVAAVCMRWFLYGAAGEAHVKRMDSVEARVALENAIQRCCKERFLSGNVLSITVSGLMGNRLSILKLMKFFGSIS